jgi:hypothetical protein
MSDAERLRLEHEFNMLVFSKSALEKQLHDEIHALRAECDSLAESKLALIQSLPEELECVKREYSALVHSKNEVEVACQLELASMSERMAKEQLKFNDVMESHRLMRSVLREENSTLVVNLNYIETQLREQQNWSSLFNRSISGRLALFFYRLELKINKELEESFIMKSMQLFRFRVANVLRYLRRGDYSGLFRRLRTSLLSNKGERLIPNESTAGAVTWSVITPPHTEFLAKNIAARLSFHGCASDVIVGEPSEFSADYYIVLCPQIFKKLPPYEKMIAYQLEQSVSSRWFNEEYFSILENSFAVLDYSRVNISNLSRSGIIYPHIHYLPIGCVALDSQVDVEIKKDIDILFYGDSLSSDRRRVMLSALGEHFDVHVANEVFGKEMALLIKRARLVINLHYYEGALLETPRIAECLSYGTPVVSESSADMDDYPEFNEGVMYFEAGNSAAMIAAVRSVLQNGVASSISTAVSRSQQRFEFMFDRFLVAIGFLHSSYVHQMTPALPINSYYVLSLPETVDRRTLAEKTLNTGFTFFDGIRRKPGWIGCGLSYLALANFAVKNHLSQIGIMEDDVVLPDDFEEKMTIVTNYLSSRVLPWHLFSGVIAHLNPSCKVLDVEERNGLVFVTVDKMTSTVFNIYNQNFMQSLQSWDPDNENAESNTIDRYIESVDDLKVVVTLPFLVGHREEVHSTLWGFQNTQYSDMISSSQNLLQKKVDEFKIQCDANFALTTRE